MSVEIVETPESDPREGNMEQLGADETETVTIEVTVQVDDLDSVEMNYKCPECFEVVRPHE